MNRIGNNEVIEGGKSLTIGAEFEKFDKSNKIFSLNLANSFKDKKNHNLPSKTKLDQTMSDIVGKFSYTALENFSLVIIFLWIIT